MRILLRSSRDHTFCKGPGAWTSDKNEALDFLTSDQAIEFARQNHLPEVQVVAQYRDNDYQIQIPYRFDVLRGT